MGSLSLVGPPGGASASGDPDSPHLVFSVTKSFIGAAFVRLAGAGRLRLDDPLDAWIEDGRLPDATLRQLLTHTSGIPDYGRLPAYHEAVRERPSEPWADEELLERALALGPDFAPGEGWAYSNTGYLLLRLVLEQLGDLEELLLGPLDLPATRLAREPGPDGYDPRWVGHRTLVSTARDVHAFFASHLTGPLADPATFVEIGFDVPGFARPSYGLGVMADPGHPLGTILGHGGGGPGHTAGAFGVLRGAEPYVAVVLGSEAADAQQQALRLLVEAVRRLPSTEEEIRAATVGEPALVDGPIRLVEHDPEWPRLYEREAARIRAALGERALLVEHVGSTSVPGLAAKPVVDVLLAVSDSADEPAYAPRLEAAGYVLRVREPDWHEHRTFKGPDTDVNLHVFSVGCAEVGRMLAFRDRLRSDDADRRLYERTKRELAARRWRYVQNYADAKSAVVEEIVARAGG